MRKVFPRQHFRHAANPVPDLAHISPATLLQCGLGAPVEYDFSSQNLPDKFDFVGAERYSKRMANLVGGLMQAQQREQISRELPQETPKPEETHE